MNRRQMFQSVFSNELTQLFDILCANFIDEVTIFDEVLLVRKVDIHYFQPLYDFSYRHDMYEIATVEELTQVEIFTTFMKVGQWDFVHTAGGTDFDLIGRVSDDVYVCVNNTSMNLVEIEESHSPEYVRSFTPAIKTFVSELCLMMKEYHV